jgi:Arc/MetJ family transcription regulator
MNWNTVGMTLVDAVTPGSTDLLYKYLANIGVQQPNDFAVATSTTITKASAVQSLGDVKIRELGTSGNNETVILGEWTLINAFITEVNFGSHSYDSDEMIEISLTLRYDWAQYTATPAGLPLR